MLLRITIIMIHQGWMMERPNNMKIFETRNQMAYATNHMKKKTKKKNNPTPSDFFFFITKNRYILMLIMVSMKIYPIIWEWTHNFSITLILPNIIQYLFPYLNHICSLMVAGIIPTDSVGAPPRKNWVQYMSLKWYSQYNYQWWF